MVIKNVVVKPMVEAIPVEEQPVLPKAEDTPITEKKPFDEQSKSEYKKPLESTKEISKEVVHQIVGSQEVKNMESLLKAVKSESATVDSQKVNDMESLLKIITPPAGSNQD